MQIRIPLKIQESHRCLIFSKTVFWFLRWSQSKHQRQIRVIVTYSKLFQLAQLKQIKNSQLTLKYIQFWQHKPLLIMSLKQQVNELFQNLALKVGVQEGQVQVEAPVAHQDQEPLFRRSSLQLWFQKMIQMFIRIQTSKHQSMKRRMISQATCKST